MTAQLTQDYVNQPVSICLQKQMEDIIIELEILDKPAKSPDVWTDPCKVLVEEVWRGKTTLIKNNMFRMSDFE